MIYKNLKQNPSSKKLTLKLTSFHSGLSSESDQNILPMTSAKFVSGFDFSDGALKSGLGFADLMTITNPLSANVLLEEGSAQEIKKSNNVNLKFDLGANLSAFADVIPTFDIFQIGQIVAGFVFKKQNSSGVKQDKFIFFNDSLYGFWCDYNDTTYTLKFLNVKFSSVPTAVNYRLNGEDVIVFCSPTDSMVVWDGVNNPTTISDSPLLTSMTIHYERLFATDGGEKTSVWFSDDFDPTNWTLGLTEAGFIQMIDERGKLLKVVSFLDYVYVFREFGISRISAYADQTEFSVSHLFTSSGEIFADTVSICGDKIIFLASDGLYVFDGVSTSKILSKIENNFIADNSKAKGIYSNGKYYLSCKMKFENEEKDVLLQINAETFEFILNVGLKIYGFMPTQTDKGLLVFVERSNSSSLVSLTFDGAYRGVGVQKKWVSPESDLGYPAEVKTIRKLHVFSKGNVQIKIKNSTTTKTINVFGKDEPQTIMCNLSGRSFGFEIVSEESQQNTYISDLVAEIYI